MPITRDRLRELVDTLPEDRLDEAGAALAILNVPDDDEPTTDEDRADLTHTHQAYLRGELIPHDTIKRTLGFM